MAIDIDVLPTPTSYISEIQYPDGTVYKVKDSEARASLLTKQDTITDLATIRNNASNGASAYTTIQGYGDIVTHNAIEFALKSEIPDVSKYALDSGVLHKTGSESITGQKTFKLNNTFANNSLDAIFCNGIFIGDGMSSTTSRLFNTRWCNNAFQLKTSQDIGYSYLASSNSNNYGLKYQVQRMPSRSSQPTSAGVVEAGMVLSYDGLIVGYSEQANKKVNDNEFIYVLDQKNVKSKTIDTLTTTDKTIIGAINEVKSSIPSLVGYATESFVTSQGYITSSYHDSSKQDVIPDLDIIREDAGYGATAYAMYDSLKDTVDTINSNFMPYDIIASLIDEKQDIITDLATIRSGASNGTTALSGLDNKQDKLNYIMVDSHIDGESGYNTWKTPLGYYCEQWGETSSARVDFVKTFANTNYNVTCTFLGSNADVSKTGHWFATGRYVNYMTRTYSTLKVSWKVSGYLAEGEY